MSAAAVRIAVVGHTNTGKTSLLRTLSRDARFGEVSDRPGTTRHVEATQLLVEGQAVAELYDTPGLEDSMALMRRLMEDGPAPSTRSQWAQRIDAFLASDAARAGRFAQEAKALRQVRALDVALYVIDAREPVLGKYRDELELLGYCGRPIVPVLNFAAHAASREPAWRAELARLGLHAVAAFDTVAVNEESERELYEKMRTLLDEHRAPLDALIADRHRLRAALIAAAGRIVAELLIDAAAATVRAPLDPPEAQQQAERDLQHRMRERERACQRQLMERFDFDADDCRAEAAPLEAGRWGGDLFSEQGLRQASRRGGGGAAGGAAVGLTLDVALAGLTLGTGTLVGTLVGGALGAGSKALRQWVDRLRGRAELRLADATLDVLLRRQVELVSRLLHRGHADQQPVELPADVAALAGAGDGRLPRPLRWARDHPGWSRLTHERVMGQGRREEAVEELAARVKGMISDF